MSWNPGAEKAPLSFLLLGIVDCHVVIENNKQEKQHTQHVGEHGELHISDHPDQLNSTIQILDNLLYKPLCKVIFYVFLVGLGFELGGTCLLNSCSIT
jgi:hypothetical protein